MKLATFAVTGRTTYGVVTPDGLIDASPRFGTMWPDLESVMAAGGLGRLAGIAKDPVDYRVDEIRLLKPVLRPGKILCVGVNYRGRNAEYRDGTQAPEYPSLFVRFPGSLVAHLEPIVRPPESQQLDYEGEIAVVMGRRARRVAKADALSCVAGYTLCNEGTIRDWTKHGKFNATPGKNFERSGSLGPVLVTPDEVGDAPLRVITRVNGEVRQDDTTDRMAFPIPTLISYISSFCTLEPGDLIVTGTPPGAGVRFDPPRFLVPGDCVEVEVSQIGTLVNPVIDEPPA